MSIGFRDTRSSRQAYYSQTGKKLGYLLTENGHKYIQNLDGRTVAKILRYAEYKHAPYTDANPYGFMVYGPYNY